MFFPRGKRLSVPDFCTSHSANTKGIKKVMIPNTCCTARLVIQKSAGSVNSFPFTLLFSVAECAGRRDKQTFRS